MFSGKGRLGLSATFAALLTLNACGGGGSSSSSTPTPTPTPPPANSAPVAAADNATTRNSAPTLLGVTENDSDADGDSLRVIEILQGPENGSAEIVDGDVRYTANPFYAGTDNLSYRVSDGQASSDATVDIVSEQALTLSGVVTDGPIGSALVRVTLGEQVFEARADENGNYEIQIITAETDADVEIRAFGSAEFGQENVELVSYVGSFEDVLALAEGERNIFEDGNLTINVTHVSTALFLMVKDSNDNQLPVDAEQFAELASNIDPEALLRVAAFIKLLVDFPAYADLLDIGLLDLLDNDLIAKTEDIISTLSAALPSSADDFEADIRQAITDTLTDPDLPGRFTVNMLADKVGVLLMQEQPGYMQASAPTLVFNQGNRFDQSAEDLVMGNLVRRTGSWSLEQGDLLLTYDAPQTSVFGIHLDDIRETYGDEVAAAVESAVAEGILSNQVEEQNGIISERFTLLTESQGVSKVQITAQSVQKLTFSDAVLASFPELAEAEIITETEQLATLQLEPESTIQHWQEEDAVGSWTLPVLSNESAFISGSPQFASPQTYLEKVTLNEDGTVDMKFADNPAQWRWSLQQGILSLQSESGDQYSYRPFRRIGKQWQVFFTATGVDNAASEYFVDKMIRFDTPTADFVSRLVTELPHSWLAGLNLWNPDNWEDGLIAPRWIFGYQMNDDGSMLRGIMDLQVFGNDQPSFFAQSQNWRWRVDGDEIWLEQPLTGISERQRIWEVITIEQQDRVLVLEHGFIRSLNDDQQLGEPLSRVAPRFNQLLLQDLSQWTEAWNNRDL